MNIKFQRELLQQIAAGVNKLEKTAAVNLEVTFICDEAHYHFSLVAALDALANDIYWDDRGNWADARTARVRTI